MPPQRMPSCNDPHDWAGNTEHALNVCCAETNLMRTNETIASIDMGFDVFLFSDTVLTAQNIV